MESRKKLLLTEFRYFITWTANALGINPLYRFFSGKGKKIPTEKSVPISQAQRRKIVRHQQHK